MIKRDIMVPSSFSSAKDYLTGINTTFVQSNAVLFFLILKISYAV